MSVLVNNSEAVTAAVNDGSYSQRVNAVQSFAQWQSEFDVAESEGLRVDVVPVSKLDTDLETRGSIAWSPRCDIVIRKKFTASEFSEADGRPKNSVVKALITLVEEIYASLVVMRLGQLGEAAWAGEEILAAYMPSHLRKNQFTGIIRVTHNVSTNLA